MFFLLFWLSCGIWRSQTRVRPELKLWPTLDPLTHYIRLGVNLCPGAAEMPLIPMNHSGNFCMVYFWSFFWFLFTTELLKEVSSFCMDSMETHLASATFLLRIYIQFWHGSFWNDISFINDHILVAQSSETLYFQL